MKVSTDACIQGAWTPVGPETKQVLDIGAGTGLLSLMLVQRAPQAMIDAVELDKAASTQALENVLTSQFSDRIRVINADASQWQSSDGYDLIICNPPFFHNALLGPDTSRNAARHVDALDAGSLIRLSLELLMPNGTASFLWPHDVFNSFKEQAVASGLHLHHQLNIQHRPGSPVTRIIGLFGKTQPQSSKEDTLTIKDNTEQYTPGFVALLRPFYLHL